MTADRKLRGRRGHTGLEEDYEPGCSAWRTPDGAYRFVNPWSMGTSIRRRWLVQEPDDDGGWFTLDDNYATLTEARKSVNA